MCIGQGQAIAGVIERLSAMVPEAPLDKTAIGVVPGGPGWFVLNATEARWRERPQRG